MRMISKVSGVWRLWLPLLVVGALTGCAGYYTYQTPGWYNGPGLYGYYAPYYDYYGPEFYPYYGPGVYGHPFHHDERFEHHYGGRRYWEHGSWGGVHRGGGFADGGGMGRGGGHGGDGYGR